MITREQCLKWAEEAGFKHIDGGWLYCGTPYEPMPELPAIESLCQRVWNEAIEAAAKQVEPREAQRESPGDYLGGEDGIALCDELAREVRRLKR